MTEVTAPDAGAPHQSLPARVVGVLLSPRETFADVVARPRVLGVLLLTIVISAAATFWFQGTEVGQKAVLDAIDQQLQLVESVTGQPISDEQYARMTAGVKTAPYQSAASIVVIFPIAILIMALVGMGVFNTMLGGSARFKQIYAIITHSSVIWTLATLVNVAIGYVKGDLSGATKLGVFLPMLESGFFARFLGYVDLFWLWGLVNLAIGFAVLYRKRTGPIAISFVAIYLVIGVVYAAVRSLISGA